MFVLEKESFLFSFDLSIPFRPCQWCGNMHVVKIVKRSRVLIGAFPGSAPLACNGEATREALQALQCVQCSTVEESRNSRDTQTARHEAHWIFCEIIDYVGGTPHAAVITYSLCGSRGPWRGRRRLLCATSHGRCRWVRSRHARAGFFFVHGRPPRDAMQAEVCGRGKKPCLSKRACPVCLWVTAVDRVQ